MIVNDGVNRMFVHPSYWFFMSRQTTQFLWDVLLGFSARRQILEGLFCRIYSSGGFLDYVHDLLVATGVKDHLADIPRRRDCRIVGL